VRNKKHLVDESLIHSQYTVNVSNSLQSANRKTEHVMLGKVSLQDSEHVEKKRVRKVDLRISKDQEENLSF
jgi:hypothetical protein